MAHKHLVNMDTGIDRIQLSVSTVSYELLEVTHATPFRKYRFNSTGLCNY